MPEALQRFAPGEWPGGLSEAFEAWKQARYAWAGEHPASVLGDFIDVMGGHVVERRRWFIGPAPVIRR